MSLLTLLDTPSGSTPPAPAPSFSPADLFAASEKGWWYDPGDLASLFQDIAGTIAVTAVGQPVGRMRDKSGNANHLVAISDAARGVLQQAANGFYYIYCDGVDDGYKTVGAVTVAASDKATILFAYQHDVVGSQVMVEHSAEATATGTFLIYQNGTFNMNSLLVSSTTNTATVASGTLAAVVRTVQYDYAPTVHADEVRVRLNGVAQAPTYSADTAGVGPFTDQIMYFMCRAGTSLLFNGRIFGTIGRFTATNDADVISTETWLNTNRIGAY